MTIILSYFKEIFRPGLYEICTNTYSTKNISINSQKATEIKAGTQVHVRKIVVVKDELRVRGQLEPSVIHSGHGDWISLASLETIDVGKQYVTFLEFVSIYYMLGKVHGSCARSENFDD